MLQFREKNPRRMAPSKLFGEPGRPRLRLGESDSLDKRPLQGKGETEVEVSVGVER